LWYNKKIKNKIQALIFTVLIGLSFNSCGYHRQETEFCLPSWIKNIYIAPWKNNSTELKLGQWITDELRQEFLRDSGIILSPKEEADVILYGTVLNAYTTGLSYVRYDQAVERRISVECKVRLVDAKTGKEIWEIPPIYREEGFYVGKDIMATEDLKNLALRKISQDIAQIIHHKVTERH